MMKLNTLILMVLVLVGLMGSVSASALVETDKAIVIDEISRTIQARGWPRQCEAFSSPKTYGAWSEIIAKELSHYDRYPHLLTGPTDFLSICPRYTQMRYQDRYNVWIMVVLAMTYYEASCNVAAKAQGPNGLLGGLFQLHKQKEGIYSANCRRGDAATAEGSIRCGLSMLDDQIRRDGKLFSEKSYWEVLRPKGRSDKAYLIRASIVGFKPCRIPR